MDILLVDRDEPDERFSSNSNFMRHGVEAAVTVCGKGKAGTNIIGGVVQPMPAPHPPPGCRQKASGSNPPPPTGIRSIRKIKLDKLEFACDPFRVNATWPLQDAKNKLSELLDTVLKQGAQTITRHGKPVAVVISAEAYAHLQPAERLVDILRDCPVKDWQLERDTTPARDLDFQ